MEQAVHQEDVGALVTELDSNTDQIPAVASDSNNKNCEPSKPGSQAFPNEIMLMIIKEAVAQDIQNVEDARNRQEPVPRYRISNQLPELVARPRIECMSIARTNKDMRDLVMGTFFKDYRGYVATYSLEAHDWLFDTSDYGRYERTLRDRWHETTLPEQIRPPPRQHIRHLRLDAEVFWRMWHAPPALANFPALQTLVIEHNDCRSFEPDPWVDYFPETPVPMSDDEDGPWQDIFHCLQFIEDLLVRAPKLQKISIEREWLSKIQFASRRFGRGGNGGIPNVSVLFAQVNFIATLDNVMTCVLEDMIKNRDKIPLTEESKYKIAFAVCDYMFKNMY